MYYKNNSDDTNDLIPMSHEEMVEHYWQASDDEPEMLADLYLDFHLFDRVEFLVFRDRLSSAIYVVRTSTAAAARDLSVFSDIRATGEHRIPGWEAESDHVLDEREGIVSEAVAVAYGAAVLSAVAALETLVGDLLSSDIGPAGRNGLQRKIESFLRGTNISTDDRVSLVGLVKTVAARRNAVAHELIGSYWQPPIESGNSAVHNNIFDKETLEDTLFKIGEIVTLIESLVP